MVYVILFIVTAFMMFDFFTSTPRDFHFQLWAQKPVIIPRLYPDGPGPPEYSA